MLLPRVVAAETEDAGSKGLSQGPDVQGSAVQCARVSAW